jgi:hypothetical protein
MANMRDNSRLNIKSSDSGPVNLEDVKIGCLQRIADATEAMAKNYQHLINDRDFYKRRYEEEKALGERMARRISALRGVITKMKKAGNVNNYNVNG